MDPRDILERLPERIRRHLGRAGEWLFVLVVARFMLATRMKTFPDFNQDANAWFFGTDAYYHARHTLYTVSNFPRTLEFDAMTQYPLGTTAGQFGTLFDQVAAALTWLAAPFLDGGAPSTATMLDVLTAYPAIVGAVSVIPIYLLVRDLFGRNAAVFAAVATALIPGSFLVRTIAGFTDHHSIEIVLSTLAVWGVYRALSAWEERDLSLEAFREDPASLYHDHRSAMAVSLLGALAFWAYLAAWPPGVLFVGIVGLWLLLQTVVEVTRGDDPVDLVVTGTTVFGFLAVLMLPYALGSHRGGFSALDFTWMQPTAPLLVALGLAGLAGLAVLWEREDLPELAYPLGALAGGLVTLGVLWVVLPEFVQQTLSGTSWVTGIGVDPTRRTIREAQPAQFSQLGGQFGWLYISAAVAFVIALVGVFTKPETRSNTLLVVWTTLATTGTFTQSRFLYYLAVAVIVLNGYLASRLFDAADVFARESRDLDEDAEVGWGGAHTAVVVVLVLMLVPTNVTGFTANCGEGTNAWSQADCFGGPGESRMWSQELDWVRENTPEPPLGLTDGFQPPEGQRYEYPEGMYGVLSWWDYGHQILFDGRRAPVANPFQQQAPLASEIFTADSEDEALQLLDDYQGEGNDARYLMVDDAMASTKFGAITVWADERDTYLQGETRQFDVEGQDRPVQLRAPGEEVRGWFLQDVYHHDGSGMEHFRLVREHPQFALVGSQALVTDQQARLQGYNTILTRGTWQEFQGVQRDQAYSAGGNRVIYDAAGLSRLKTYERVAGATLVGEAEPGTTVEASLDLHASASDRPFTYETSTEAGEDGRFALTVPYSTNDEVGPGDGGTDLSVEATGPYAIDVGNESLQLRVPETAVLAGDTIEVTTAP